LRSIRRVESVIRQEMDNAGAQEMLMPFVHAADVWRRTGRYDAVDATLVRLRDRSGRELVLGMTHEEIVAQLAASEIVSRRDAGVVVYQIQTKFRDEARARGGLLRTREFIMKDAYSLHVDEAGRRNAYDRQSTAYHTIFRRLGLRDVHRVESATGDMGGTGAHEFMCLLEVGDDAVAFCDGCGFAANVEVARSASACGRCGEATTIRRAVEVGNIFELGTRYTEALDAVVTHADGVTRPLVMGSYGIGVGRLLACLIEQGHDARGIALAAAAAPFDAHVVALGAEGTRRSVLASELYAALRAAGVDALLDDRDARAGEKFADADLIGAPIIIAVGNRADSEGVVELRERRKGRTHEASIAEAPSAVRRIVADLVAAESAAA
jgi:prolyl-tRNA synthetase